MSLLLWGDDAAKGADLDFNGPMLGMPYSLSRLGFTYTRNSPKSAYQNNALVTASANQFVTTQDSVTGLYAFEAEPAATNLALNSILAGGGAAPTSWTQPVATGTSAPSASIYGAASSAVAYLQSAAAQRPFLNSNITVSANTTYTASVLVESKSGTLTAADCITIATPPAGATVTYPVCSANPSGGASGALTTGTLSVNIAVAATAGTFGFRLGLGGAGAVTGTLQFSRPQCETGLRRTSWIATTTGTVTRAADVLSCAVANIPGFSAAGYTLFVDGRNDVLPVAAGQYGMTVSDGTSANRAAVLRTDANAVNLVVSGNVTQANQTTATTILTRSKMAGSFSANSFLFAHNGTAPAADTSGSMPISPTTLAIGAFVTTNQFNGYIYRVRLIPTALNQAQTTGLTA